MPIGAVAEEASLIALPREIWLKIARYGVNGCPIDTMMCT
jgi:hypothetical protein